MLEPESRQLLLDSLRPPPGFAFDQAIGTTFTLDLLALLVTPVAFAMFDVEANDGSMGANPIAILEAVRRNAERITVFCQAGQMKVPGDFRSVFAYLEPSVVSVRAPRRGGIFHPKVWVLRFIGPHDEVRYRLLCLSRNLTFDRSWDTVLRLDGRPTGSPQVVSAPLADFMRALPRLAVAPVPIDRVGRVDGLAQEVSTVEWEPLPDNMRLERLWPIGHDGTPQWPFPERSWRRLVLAPFAEAGFVQRFTAPNRGDMIVSRPETLDAIGAGPLAHLERRCVLRAEADAEVEAPETAAREDARQSNGDRTTELAGLHAKLFVTDDAWWSRIWTGSANATMAAFTQNVEFLVELKARNTTHGVRSLVNAPTGRSIGFGRLLMDYDPPAEPVPLSSDEEGIRALDRLAMTIGALNFTAEATPFDDDSFGLRLVGKGNLHSVSMSGPKAVHIAVRPLSLGRASAIEPVRGADSLAADWVVSFSALTAFFAIDLTAGHGIHAVETSLLVRAELSGAPEDRLERVLASELHSRSDLMRLLLLLLGGLEPAFGDLVDVISGEPLAKAGSHGPILGSEAFLEPLMRTLARNPARLDEIERLVEQLKRTDEGRELLPEGWGNLWHAVTAARIPKGSSV